MNIENFEKRAQSEFEGFRPEIDTDQIWQNIEPHLKKKKKRRLFILFFWGLGAGLLLLTLLKWNSPANNTQAQQVAVSQKTERTPEMALDQSRNESQSMHVAPENTISEPRKIIHPSNNSVPRSKTTVQPIAAIYSGKSMDKVAEKTTLNTATRGISGLEAGASMEPIALPNIQIPLQKEATTTNSTTVPLVSVAVTAPKIVTEPNEADSEANPAGNTPDSKSDTPKSETATPEKTKPAKAKKPAKIKPCAPGHAAGE